jgi:putative endonuclease
MLRSLRNPEQRYTGYTTDLKTRLASYNRAENNHTAKYVPWTLEAYVAFLDEAQAKSLESYLKTGSGQAFANKRFWRNSIPSL